jgi:hypothetical protein
MGNTETFQTLSSSDLASCKCLGSTFFGEGQMTVFKTNIVNDCMGSLFLASSMLIKANCKFWIWDTREKIFCLGNNTWLVYSVGTIATNHVSPKARSSSPLTISSRQAIMVQPGCHTPTMDHMITVDDSNDLLTTLIANKSLKSLQNSDPKLLEHSMQVNCSRNWTSWKNHYNHSTGCSHHKRQ